MTAPVITALPTAPSRSNDPDTFVSRADAWVAAISTWTSEANALGTWSNNTATTVQSNTTTSTTAASNASASASAAAASAASALNSATTQGTSTTSNTLGIGSKTFTTQTGKGFVAGMYVLITATTGNWMHGQVTSYTTGSGSITINVERYSGTFGAAFTSWNIALSAPATLVNPVTQTIASATNIMLYSQDYTNAAWTKTNSSVTNGFSDPLGTLNATKLIENNTTGLHSISQSLSVVAGNVYCFSCFVKAAERTYIGVKINAFSINSGDVIYFNLSNGTIDTGAALTSKTVEVGIDALPQGWYRIWLSGRSFSNSNTVSMFLSNGSGVVNYTGDNVSGVYIFGAQLESQVANPGQYVTTTSASASGSGKVTTNLYPLYSERGPDESMFNVTITDNNMIAPNGTPTGAKISATAANSVHYAGFNYSWVQGRHYTLTFYVKWDGSGVVNEIRTNAASTVGTVGLINFNFLNQPNGNGSTVVPVGDGWYKFTTTFTPTATQVASYFFNLMLNGSTTFLGDGSSGLFIWGLQLEESLSPGGYVKVDNGVSQTSSHAVAQLNSVVEVDTSKAALTIALPHNPTKNSYVEFYDTSEGFIINPLTIQRNTKTIENLHEDMIVSSNINGFKMVYNGITWKVV